VSGGLEEGRVAAEGGVWFGTKLLFGVTASVSVLPVLVLEIPSAMSGNG